MPTPGFLWVEATLLCFIDAEGYVRAQIGYPTGASGAAGFAWIEGDRIYYTDSSGSVRYLPYADAQLTGTMGFWLEDTIASRKNYINYIIGTGAGRFWHENSHSDLGHQDGIHQDILHGDYTDSYTDYPHGDSGGYTDYPHGDYSDKVHTDSPHGDTGKPYSDYPHGDHYDYYHGDVPHGDAEYADVPHQDSHTDTPVRV